MDQQNVGRMNTGLTGEVLNCVISYIDEPEDLGAISLVCRGWYEIDRLTRKHVTIPLCYTTTPERLRSRFPNLESLELIGEPRADCVMFDLIPEDWGGYAAPWVKEIAQSFKCLKSIHFCRMIITDSDLELLLRTRGSALLTLKIDRCSGFSTDGLLEVGRYCRNLKHLFLEESYINEKDGGWLHELATKNTALETLNFYKTYLEKISVEDLELIARNCLSLCSVKFNDIEILNLVGFLRTATNLEEFGGGAFYPQVTDYSFLSLPQNMQNLRKLGLTFIQRNMMHIVFPFASRLTKLDLRYTVLDEDDHCVLLQRCPNLECLGTTNDIGDRGLQVVGRTCKRLKRLGLDKIGDGIVSQRGLIAIAQGCLELEYLDVYVSDIANNALEYMGALSKNLCDFRLALLDKEAQITELPLDRGVRALLMGCEKLRRFALYLRRGGLTDVGLGYVGQCSQNVRQMLLGCVGESDAGLLEFSRGCPNLQKLEMRGCFFSEHALAVAVTRLHSLRFLWVQGYRGSSTGRDLGAMARPYWNIELIPASRFSLSDDEIEDDEIVETEAQSGDEIEDGEIVETGAHILAYYSLAGQRTDLPEDFQAL